jgi:hypothetical protein
MGEHPPKTPARIARRLKRRREARAKDKRMRELGAKFGEADPRAGEDRRQVERRDTSLSPAEVERRLKQLGITDRRRGQRRSGGERRT